MSKTYSAGIVTAYGAAKRAGYQGTYEDFCRQQAGYAESAATVEQAKNTAVSAANTATIKAGEATTAATAAQTAKTQTEAAASQALTDIGTARSGAISAVQTEGQTQTANARAQAQAAAQSATTASTKASEASASATSAGQSATNAAASAASAAQSASNAQNVLDSIPADYSEMSADVEQLKADLDDLDGEVDTNTAGIAKLASGFLDETGNEIITITEKGKYIDLSGTSVTMDNGVPVASGTSGSYSYVAVPCVPGEKFTINGTGGNSTRLWGFVSSNGTVTGKAGQNATGAELVITAPANSVYLIIHNQINNPKQSYRGIVLQTRVSNLENSLSVLDVSSAFDWESGSIGTNDGKNANSATRIRTSGYIAYDKDAVVSIPSGYKWTFRLYQYGSYGSFVWGNGYWETESDVAISSIVTKRNGTDTNANYIRFILAKSDDSTISDPFITGLNFIYKHAFNAQESSNLVDMEKPELFPKMYGNMSIRCAKEQSYVDGTKPKIEWYLLEEAGTGRFFYSRDLTSKTYLFTFPYIPYKYSFGILKNGDIIAVLDADSITTENKSDTNRRNPYVFLAAENWSICHEVDFGSSLKPCGWLSNCGFKLLANGTAIFCEYTRQTTYTANVWLLSGDDPTNASNWTVTKSFVITSTDNQTGFKHCHMVVQDFYTGVCYLSTGDDSVGAMMFYSADNGKTWTQLQSPDSDGQINDQGWITGSQMYCRNLNLIFTEDYIYWCTDSYIASIHKLFRATRGNDGVLDFSTVTALVSIPNVSDASTYGLAYLPEYNALMLLDRTDSVATEMPLRLVTLADNELHTIGKLYVVTEHPSGQHLGFRTRFSEWYPINGVMHFGYGMHVNHYNDDVNHNKGFGNLGSSEKKGMQTINNLIVRVFKNGDDFGFTMDTIYI